MLFLFFFDTDSYVTELTVHTPVCPFPLNAFSKLIYQLKEAFEVSSYFLSSEFFLDHPHLRLG